MANAEQDPGGPAQLGIPVRIGIVFDLDGTLIDSRVDIANATNHALATNGFATRSVSEISSFVGDGARALLERAARLTAGAQELQSLLDAFLAYYAAHPTDHTLLTVGAHEALSQLSHLPLALCTNKPRAITEAVLANLRLPVRFAALVASGDVPKNKPDPLPLLRIASALSLAPSELVMVGDGPQDILCAKAAGARSIGIEGGMQSAEKLLATNPDVLLRSLTELPSVIERWQKGG